MYLEDFMPHARKHAKRFTYADYLTWDESVRVELIRGEVFDMTPAPSRKHQSISMIISGIFWNFLKDKKFLVFAAPFDVRLPDTGPDDADITTVVQPDIVVVCDRKKLDDWGCLGAPDMIVEITSPGTAAKDMREKLTLYEKHGVKEYWIIHPLEKTLMVFLLNREGSYGKPAVYAEGDTVKVKSIRGLAVAMDEVFRD